MGLHNHLPHNYTSLLTFYHYGAGTETGKLFESLGDMIQMLSIF